MRISDWSSDVCSSDLSGEAAGAGQAHRHDRAGLSGRRGAVVGRPLQHLQPRRPGADRRGGGVGSRPTPQRSGLRPRAGTRGSKAMRMLASAIALAIAAPASAQTPAIVHAEAWTMESDTPVPAATILVDGRRTVSVTPGGAVPAGVRTLDARGKPVTPGFRSEEPTSELQPL